MLLPTAKTREIEDSLFPHAFDRIINSIAQTRNHSGDFFEEATASITGASRLKTDSQCDYCPDLAWKDNIFFESKSIGKTCQIILYDHRHAKDKRFVRASHKLYYFCWHHTASLLNCRFVSDARDRLASGVHSLYIIPMVRLNAYCREAPTRVLNTKYGSEEWGFTRNGYGIGWSIPLHVARSWAEKKISMSLPFHNVYGKQLSGFEVYLCGRNLEQFLT